MIRINLLKPLEPQALPLILAEPAGKRKTPFLVLGGLVLIAVIAIAVLQFPSLFGGMLAGKRTAETAPVPPTPKPEAEESVQPKRVTSQAVEETVRDLQEDKTREQIEPSYSRMVPSEKIEFQYYASSRVLKDVKAVTPPDVGFANFIFTPPGDFYVHGLAADDRELQRFHEGLAGLTGSTVRLGMNVPAGSKGKGKEFSFFASVKYPLNGIRTPPDHVIEKSALQKELKQLKTVANGLGIRLKEPRLLNTSSVGNVNRMIYQTSADCSFQQMQDLLAGLHEGKSNLGFIKFALRARGDEKVVADMDILAYVQP
ncbi:MAG TPA: hypothetical protein VJ385_15345 [Fibrobacteria bacterium]|nr:hypothetical protein [Fibrobacteria bacterium]